MTHWLDHLTLVSLGLVVAALAALPARRLLHRDPSACYRLSLALLLGALALLPVQWIVQGVAHEFARPLRERLPAWLDRVEARDRPDETILVERAPTRAPERSTVPRTTEAESIVAAAALAAPASEASRAAAWRARASAMVRSAAARLRGGAGLLLWLAGAALLAGRRLIGLLRTRRLVRRARPVDDPQLLELWRRVAAGSRVGARTRLLAASEVRSPACVGWLRPALLLPEAASPPMAPDVLAWALRHELVHLERGDWLVAALQSLVTSALWFHPAAWWLSAEVGRLRELSCDQVVVEGFGRRRSYALALLEYAAAHRLSVPGNPHPAIDAGPHSAGVRCALLHWSRSPSQIQRRIEMLTVDSRPRSGTRRALGRVLALSAFVVPALGQVGVAATLFPKDPASAAQAAPAPVTAPGVRATSVRAPADDGKRRADDAKKKAAIAANAQDQAIAALKARLAEEHAVAEKTRADGRDRAAALKTKLKAAHAAGDEAACAALEAALEKCAAECEAACADCDERCEELADALDSCVAGCDDGDFETDDVDVTDLSVDFGDIDFDAWDQEDFDFEGDVDFGEFDFGGEVDFPDFDYDGEVDLVIQDSGQKDLALQYAGTVDDDDDVRAARAEKAMRAMADAEKRLAEASARIAKLQQAGKLDVEVQQKALARQKEAMARDMEKMRRGLDEAGHARKLARVQADESLQARKHALKARGSARRVSVTAPGEAERATEPLAPAPPQPADEPGLPRVRTPRPPRVPTAPTPAPSPVAPRVGASEEMLQQRIEALERELHELRAALAEQRARETRGTRSPRVRSMQ